MAAEGRAFEVSEVEDVDTVRATTLSPLRGSTSRPSHPALKRWANLFRAYGAGCHGLAPGTICSSIFLFSPRCVGFFPKYISRLFVMVYGLSFVFNILAKY